MLSHTKILDRYELYTLWSKHVDEHRAHVFAAGELLGVSPFRLGNHDITKYWEVEAEGYAYRIIQGRTDDYALKALEKAFLHHVHHNDHHWQHWHLGLKCIEMDPEAVKEMVADWMATGVTQTMNPSLKKTYDCREWLAKSGPPRSGIHHKSLALVDAIINSPRYETVVKLLDSRLQEDHAIVASPQAP